MECFLFKSQHIHSTCQKIKEKKCFYLFDFVQCFCTKHLNYCSFPFFDRFYIFFSKLLTSSTEKELKETHTVLRYIQVAHLDIIADMLGHIQQTLQVCVCVCVCVRGCLCVRTSRGHAVWSYEFQ